MSSESITTLIPFRRAIQDVIKIALIMSLRVFGLFMVLPVIALYASQFSHSNGFLIGLATGIYGLSQAALQIPFGILSDRYGRKRLIALGLTCFILGSLICALSPSIYWLILGRCLQGAGAIGSVLIALIADTTPEYHLGKAMAIIGITMASSFLLAFTLGPFIQHAYGVPALFYASIGFGILALFVLTAIPTLPVKRNHRISRQELKTLWRDPQLMRINVSIFLQHAILTANFVVIPFIVNHFAINHSRYYLMLLASAFILALPIIRLAENRQRLRQLLLFATALTGVAQLVLWLSGNEYWSFSGGLFLYFFGFSLLEALLPALASRFAPEADRGFALGIYSSSQFLGLFCGGTLGGLMIELGFNTTLFCLNAIMSLLWVMLANGVNFKQNHHHSD